MKKVRKRILSVLLAAAMLLTVVPLGTLAGAAADPPGELKIASMSDIHLYPKSLQPDPSDTQKYQAWREFCVSKSKQFIEGPGILEAALDALAKQYDEGVRYLVVSGDLTKDSEYEAHRALAAAFEQFMADHPGFQVFVINGNHDINNSDACTFINGKAEPTRQTTPQEFAEIYKNCGYDAQALNAAGYDYASFVSNPAGASSAKAGMLSYAVTLPGGYRLIAMDAAKYSPDATESGTSEHETGGNIPPALMEWIMEQCAQAKAKGQTVIGLTHFNLVTHFAYEARILQDFTIDNWEVVCDQLADAGMNFAFTGHMHSNDIAKRVSDEGNVMIDCETGSLSSFPNTFRVTDFDNTKGAQQVSANYKTISCDSVSPVVADGKTITSPYAKYSFNISYGAGLDANGVPKDADAADFLKLVVKGLLDGFLSQMQGPDGILGFLKGMNLDLEGLLGGLIGEGISVGPIKITTGLVMALVSDLLGQIETRYIDNPAQLYRVINGAIDKLAAIQVSSLPNAKFVAANKQGNPLGMNFGATTGAGTLGDIVLNCLYYMYMGNEDISDDPFTQDVIKQLEGGDTAQRLIDTLLDVLLNDLVEKELLPNLTLHTTDLAKKYPDIKFVVDIVEGLTGPNPTLDKVVGSVLGMLGGADSLGGLLQGYMDKYFTASQLDSIGDLLAGAVADLSTDTNPAATANQDAVVDDPAGVTYTNEQETVVPTAADYRLPSNIAVTFGEKADSTRNINWYTKYSVTGTDVQIVPYSDSPTFTDDLPAGVKVTVDETLTGPKTMVYPGVDFGVIGILSCNRELYRHAVSITGLQPGTKYCYRVGDAQRGWWSPAGVLETADNSEGFTFLHMSDSQSQNEKQYKTFGNVLNTAFSMYPQAKFILHTGDFVDKGDNCDQWQWGLNAGGQILRNTVLMEAVGNHEAKGENAIMDNYYLSNLPQQDTTLGAYYSFDYNNAHFMVLNTNNLSADEALSDDQLAWLKADAAASDAQWKIVALHKAPYSNGSHYGDGDVKALRAQLSVLMPDLGIDVVLQGHDHVYLRTKVLDENLPVDTMTQQLNGYEASVNPAGTVYAISACAGVKSYRPQDDILLDESAKIVTVDAPVFSAIRIEGNALYFDAIEVDGDQTQTIDSFAILKDSSIVPPTPAQPDAPNDQNNNPATGDGLAGAIVMLTLAAGAAFVLSSRKRSF